jgi:acetyl-CoA synthetase
MNSEQLWTEISKDLHWFKPWKRLKNVSYQRPVKIAWYEGGTLNACHNALDRHLADKKDQVALIWEADDVHTPSIQWTYGDLAREVNQMAATLQRLGVKKGDRVTIYLPMVLEAVVAMLSCARLGAIHSVVFGGFSPDSLSDRINDGDSRFVITADEGRRGGKKIPLKHNVDEALKKVTNPVKVLVVKVTGSPVDWDSSRDFWWHEEKTKATEPVPCEEMDAQDPLFILYTSGSTGKPKGVLHTTGGYLAYALHTFKTVFQYRPKEIYWCTADVGWITGHSYMVYGPLAAGATVLIFEGVPNYPKTTRFWEIIDKHQVNIFYTAPTALRALMREGEDQIKPFSLASLRLLGSVGEPINPEAWNWYHRNVGRGRCEIVDTWWQTETGGILISPQPGKKMQKPGSATKALPGIEPVVLSPEGKILEGACVGILVLKDSWPGQMRTVYKDHQRFEETYFSAYPGYYFTGDGCRRDADGDYWITGRVDDVLNVSGHRLGTAELESALVAHPSVAEAAVVGYPHDIKGQGIYAYVTLKVGVAATDDLRRELIAWVSEHISPIAKPDLLQWAPGLPKTRSGKIMRRILRKLAENQPESLGDISTLADPSVVKDLTDHRLNRS